MSGGTNSNSLPEWQCDGCGNAFSAITRDQLKDKVSQHLSDCDAPEIWECERCGWTISKSSDHYGKAKGTHIRKCHLILNWRCRRCGQEFDATDQDDLEELKQRHRDESHCHDEPTYTPELERVSTQDIPRDPSAYQPSDHFAVRKAKRQEPPVESEVIEKLIKDGWIKPTHHRERFLFEREVGDWTWRLLVGMVDKAFLKPSKKHTAITIYALGSEQHEVADKLGL